MSQFSTLFPTYTSDVYTVKLTTLLKQAENAPLAKGTSQAGEYGFGQPYTIGYGYDISQQSGQQIIADFINAGIFVLGPAGNITGTGQYAVLYNALQTYTKNGPTLNAVDAAFTDAFGTVGLTEAQASSLLDVTISRYDADLTDFVNQQSDAGQAGFTLGNNGLHILILSEWYNGIFGSKQRNYIATDNVWGFLADVLFFNNTISKGEQYDPGLENRRISDLAAALGIGTSSIPSNISSDKKITTLNFGGNLFAALDVAQAITANNDEIKARIDSLASLVNGQSANGDLPSLENNLLQNAEATLISKGYYVPQPGQTWDQIAAAVGGIDGTTLQRINNVLPGSSFVPGGLAYVPFTPASPIVPGSSAAIARTTVFDAAPSNGAGKTYVVGSALDGSDAGALVIIDKDGTTREFDAGTWWGGFGVGIDPVTGDQTVTLYLTSPSRTFLSELTLDTVTNEGTLTPVDGELQSDGFEIHLNDIPAHAHVTVAGGTPEQEVLSFLNSLGDQTTAAELELQHSTQLNPVGQSYSIYPSPDAYGDDFNSASIDARLAVTSPNTVATYFNLFSSSPPGAIIQGVSSVNIDQFGVGVSYSAYNVLNIGTGTINISQDVISDVQELDLNFDSAVLLTDTQLHQFDILGGEGTLIAATGGTFDLRNVNVYSNSFFWLRASDWSGTTLIGNNQDGQSLFASLYGNDTLIAGNGAGDNLYAGEGVDTLIGGIGGDNFYAYSGLTADSVVRGTGSNNTLYAMGDISLAAISGVQTLTLFNQSGLGAGAQGAVTLSSSEFNNFTSIQIYAPLILPAVFGTINAATGGTYDLRGKSLYAINMTANSTDGTTLIGNDAAGETLIASSSGNDTLTAGNGGTTLVAGTGNDTMTGGTGNDIFYAGAGNDVMQSDGGNDIFDFTNASPTGRYTIIDFHLDNSKSVLRNARGISASQITLVRIGDDLVENIGADPITIQNYFAGSAFQIDSIQFSDGTELTSQQIDAAQLSDGETLTSQQIEAMLLGPTLLSSALAVASSQSVSNVTVISGGDLILAGGAGTGIVVSSGGVETVSSGGTDLGTTVRGGGEEVFSGGVASNTVISSGGYQNVYSGGVAANTTIDGGFQGVSGGTAIGTTINSSGVEIVSSGGVVVEATVGSGGNLQVYAGGSASNDVVLSGGLEIVDSGGMDLGGTLSGGQLLVYTGGTVFDDVVLSGSFLQLGLLSGSAGGTASGTVVSSGGFEFVHSGGADVNATVSNGGNLQVYAGGNASNDVILRGGIMLLGISGLGAGGTASGTIVSSGGLEIVDSGGMDIGGTLRGGQSLVYTGGNTFNDVVLSGSFLQLGLLSGSAGGTASGTVVSGGGFEIVHSGGADIGATVGGELQVFAGGTASDDVVLSGGLLLVGVTSFGAGGMVSDTVVDAGGIVVVSSGGSTISASLVGTAPSGGGGREIISAGGSAFFTSLSASAQLIVSSGGVAVDTVVNARTGSFNGGMTVSSGGVAIGSMINSGGFEFVSSGGTDVGATINIGGDMVVNGGGSTVSATVIGGGASVKAFEILNGGTASATTLIGAGVLNVLSGGLAANTIISSTNFSTPGGNGGLFVSSGGFASGTVINSGGLEVIFNSGTEGGATVNSGGLLVVSAGGTAIDSIDSFGARMSVIGTASGATINSGGVENVSSGGLDISAVINDGGTQTVFAGGSARGTIVNDPGLQIVSAGGTASGVTLNGGEQDVYGTASGTVIDSGGFQIVSSGGTASGTDIASGGTEYVQSGGIAIDVSFIGTGGLLKLDQPSGLGGTLSNFAIGDTIDFVSASISSAGLIGNTLTITEAGGQSYAYQVANPQQRAAVSLQDDGSNGTDLVLLAATPTVDVAINKANLNIADNTGTVSFTFSTAPTDFSLSDVTSPDGILSNLSGSGTSYTATFTASAGVLDTAATVSVVGGSYHDADGTAGSGGSTAAFTVDTVAPTLTPIANQLEEATGPNGAASSFAATASDPSDGTDPVVFTEGNNIVHSGDIFSLGTHTITASATDAAGNTSSETFTITVRDTTPPTLTPVANQTDEATSAAGAVAMFAATATDLVDGTDPVVFTEGNTAVHSGDTFSIGNHTITASATDVAGNTASETFTITVVNTATAPTVTSTVASPSTGDKNTGAVITLMVTMSENVTVTGTPALMLNDGGVAIYQSGSGSNTLVFTYTVANAQNAAVLAVTGNNLNGSSIAITDAGGNAADLSGANVAFAGLAIGATVSSVTANPPSGDLGPGKTITFTVTMSEAVTVSGVTSSTRPYLTLSDGGRAVYTGGSGTNTLTFSYTVGALGSGQNASALAVTGFNPNGATVFDSHIAADTADLSGVAAFAGGPQIDTTAPTVTSVTASGAGITNGNGDLDAGSTVTLTVNFSEAVTVAGGTPTLTLNDGGTATYAGGSGTTALTFTYTVAAGQNTADLGVTGFALDGATIRDGAGNNAIRAGAVTNPTGILQIDTRAPTITSITTSGASIANGVGDLNAGNTVTLTVNFSENVMVAGGMPTLTLNDGGIAGYAGGSGTNALTFTYQVAAGQNTSDLTVTGLALGAGTTIKDAAGNAAVLSGAVRNPAGILKIDTTAPTVTRVVASPGTGEVTTGHSIRITLDTSEAVTVGGTPTLLLNDGGTATYDPAHSTTTALAFNYTVAAGQVTSDLVVSGIELPSSSAITDRAGNAADLSGAGANLRLRINTTATGPAGPGGGSFSITGDTELELFGASTANVTFAPGDTGVLKLDSSSQFKGTVAGLAPGDELDLADIGFGATTTLGYTQNAGNTGGTLTVSDGTHSAAIALLGQYIAENFVLSGDSHSGIVISDPPPSPPLLTQSHA